jgi:hypothetical protein
MADFLLWRFVALCCKALCCKAVYAKQCIVKAMDVIHGSLL